MTTYKGPEHNERLTIDTAAPSSVFVATKKTTLPILPSRPSLRNQPPISRALTRTTRSAAHTLLAYLITLLSWTGSSRSIQDCLRGCPAFTLPPFHPETSNTRRSSSVVVCLGRWRRRQGISLRNPSGRTTRGCGVARRRCGRHVRIRARMGTPCGSIASWCFISWLEMIKKT